MLHSSPSALRAWGDFYVIIGSAAASLTGLMFVVITLVAGVRGTTTRQGLATFSTPTVVHFSAALGISAVLAAPWPTLYCASALLAAGGIAGLAYAIRITVHALAARGGSDYEPDWEDHVFYLVLPVVAYAAILGSGIALSLSPHVALFVLAGASLLLIFIGIHNSWDVVVYVTATHPRSAHDDAGDGPPAVSAESTGT